MQFQMTHESIIRVCECGSNVRQTTKLGEAIYSTHHPACPGDSSKLDQHTSSDSERHYVDSRSTLINVNCGGFSTKVRSPVTLSTSLFRAASRDFKPF